MPTCVVGAHPPLGDTPARRRVAVPTFHGHAVNLGRLVAVFSCSAPVTVRFSASRSVTFFFQPSPRELSSR